MATPGPAMCCPLWAECQASSRSPPPSLASSRSAGPRLEGSGPGTFPIERQGFRICLGLDGAGCERGAWTTLMEPSVGVFRASVRVSVWGWGQETGWCSPGTQSGALFPLACPWEYKSGSWSHTHQLPPFLPPKQNVPGCMEGGALPGFRWPSRL